VFNLEEYMSNEFLRPTLVQKTLINTEILSGQLST